jgi:ABC-type phosphate/phosphonate transport system ATPase subunit
MLSFNSVAKIYKNNYPALDGVSFQIDDKEFVSIVGRSGAGQSTLV